MPYVNTAPKRSRKHHQGQWRIGLGLSALLLLTIAALLQKVPDFVLLLYLAMSILAYSLYAYDKKAAQRGRWRISEQTLQQVAFLGGWPGALIAQTRLHHKTVKPRFQAAFWLMVAFNIGGLLALIYTKRLNDINLWLLQWLKA
jgi:uncharacterized membrane protein YsdA (DUF1294 family)